MTLEIIIWQLISWMMATIITVITLEVLIGNITYRVNRKQDITTRKTAWGSLLMAMLWLNVIFSMYWPLISNLK